MAWSDIPDVQTPSWGNVSPSSTPAWGTVPDTQTPNWVQFLSNLTTAFQANAFQYDSLAFQIGQAGNWSLVDDNETPNWSVIPT